MKTLYMWEITEIDPGVFQAIACSLDMFHIDGPLSPNLREISCSDGDRDIFWNVYSFLSSKLQAFRLYVKQGPGLAALTILSALRAKSLRMKNFGIHGGWFFMDELTPHISTSLCG